MNCYKARLTTLLSSIICCILLVCSAQGATVFIHCNQGQSDTLGLKGFKANKELSEFLQADLIEVLTDYGHTAKTISGLNDFVWGDSHFLLKLHILTYTPGNMAARFTGGGETTLHIKYSLCDTDRAELKAFEDTVIEKKSWKKISRRVNSKAASVLVPHVKY